MRVVSSFNDNWLFSKSKTISSSLPKEWESVTLPHTWNNIDGQDGGNDYWRGTATYVKTFPRPSINRDERVFIEFKGAAMTADVFLNGKHVSTHRGGYSRFRADITPYLEDENIISLNVDNSSNTTVYPQKADFTFYGGIYRDVNMIIVPSSHFELVKNGSNGIKITPNVDLEKKEALVTVETWQEGGDEVSLTIYDSENNVVEEKKKEASPHSSGSIKIENVHLWDGLEDPYLYRAEAVLIENGEEKDTVSSYFGCRTYCIDPEKGFFLNGRSYPLRGVSRHQDRKGKGNAISMEDMEEDMALIREIGANTLRLAHYQHADEFYDLCDRNGLVVWAEIPYITMHMDEGRENTIEQMTDLVTQCYNHPSIVVWGLSNEITASGKVTEDLMENHRILNDICHSLDKTRLTTMAHAFMLEQESPVINLSDVGSYNLYFGWYLGELDQNDSFFDEYHAKFPNRCIGFAEYGADANPKLQSENPERSDYTESYQCVYHEHILSCIEKRPYIWASHVWNMFDFAADGREEGGKKGENQKGLVTFDRKIKKDAFFLYKAAWNKKDKFVHICGKRYVDRENEKTNIKVYSNLSHIDLFVDGKLFSSLDGERVFNFPLTLTGEHLIEARSGEYSDSVKIRKVAEPNPEYSLRKKSSVINWFDKESFDSSCYSIQDRMCDIKKSPEAAVIINNFQAMVRRGQSNNEVARSTHGNENLQKMIDGMKLESMLKSVADRLPEGFVEDLNKKLQKIKKVQ